MAMNCKKKKSVRHLVLLFALLLCSTGTALAQWTDPNTGVTFTPISGTNGFNANEGYASGCDGNVGTKYCSNEANRIGDPLHWELVVQASQAIKLTGYTITTGNDDSGNQNRRPYSWQIQGSNDNANWTTIATVTNDNVIQPVNNTEYPFTCTTGNAYTYFRFYITAIRGDGIVQYSEFHPIGFFEPTGISVINKSIEIDDGATSLAYTLTPIGAYDRVAATSSNTGIFTVSSPNTTGSVTITPVAAGTATLTLTAYETDNTTVAATTTATITVFVRPEAAPTAITAKNMMAYTGSSTLYTDYTLAVADPATNKPHNFVSATSSNTAVASITNNANGTFTINAIADGTATITINAYGLDNTTVAATTTFTVTVTQATGVSAGGIVTLNDLEDHSWSYYSDPACPIRSLNPADVKITYYGNGTNTVSTSNNTNPGNTFTASTNSAVAVNVTAAENQHTFVYYKTLERTDGATAASVAAATGRCAYTTIPNPFQKRPVYGTNATSKWRGFYAWRVKSVTGGTIYTAATGGTAIAAGSTINAETTVYFAPTNSTGMEVELEALWARAYVATSGTNGANNIGSYTVGYERNFLVLTTGNAYRFGGDENRRISNTGYAATISRYYPDGTVGNADATVRGNNDITLGANTKFENLAFSNMGGNTLTAAGHDLIVGRGCSGTVNITRGMGGNSNNTLNYTIRLESGVFNYVSFTAGYYNNNDESQGAEYTFSGANNSVKGVMGCDYDRAVEKSTANYNYTTAPLRVTYNMILGATPTFSNQAETEYFNATIKSGYYGSGSAGLGSGSAANAFYLGVANTYNTGKRRLTVEGGNLNLSLAGGIDEDNTSDDALTIRMKGGTVAGAVYGAAAFAAAAGGRRFIFTGGTVGGWIAGGCNGTQTDGGKLDGKTFIYFGGTAQCNSNGSNTTIGPGLATGGNIFGAGSGNAGSGANATVGEVDQSTIVIADESMVERNVYGGGNYGYVAGTGATNKSDIYILGGDVKGAVFGGANMQKGNIVNITMNGGLVESGIYGGSNARGNISGNVTMHIDGGQVGTSSQSANIHGGGYGNETRVLGSVNLTLGSGCDATEGVTVYGDVYGGSAEGRTNGDNARNGTAVTNVTLYKGTINGGLYGGGLGSATYPAYVYGPVAVKVFGGSVRTNDGTGENGSGGVFGCNNVNGAPQSTVTVDIYGTDPAPDANSFALFAVYGGGNRSHYTAGVPVVTIHGCSNSIEYVYGGGNASNVPGTNVTIWGGHIGNAFGGGNGYSVTGNHTNAGADHYNPGANITTNGANLTIHGGTIDAAFGGSNQYGTINGGINVAVNEQKESGSDTCGNAYSQCPLHIIELFGGGNEARAITSAEQYINSSINITSCGATIDNLYGGAKKAIHGAPITLNVKGGNFQNVFGGSQGTNEIAANIEGTVTLNLNGGTMVNAFGGNDVNGNITGKITVNVLANQATCPLHIDNVYGGGRDAAYAPTNAAAITPEVNILNGRVNNAVFGGGLGRTASVTSNPKVTVGDADDANHNDTVGGTRIDGVTPGDGNVFGGGELGQVLGYTEVDIKKGTIDGSVFGAGLGSTSDKDAGLVTKNTTVNITGGTINTNVYGSGNLASVGTITNTTQHTNTSTSYALSWPYEFTYNNSTGAARVNITGGTIGGDVYGSSRGTVGDRYTSGLFASTRVAYVDINLTNAADTIFGDVYGSGENGHVYDTAMVTLRNGLVLGSVFGGGKGIDKYAGQLTNPSTSATYNADIYDIIAGKVFGNTYVNILGGRVAKNVYGGGNMASVGKGNYKGYGEGDNVSQADSLLAENSGHCYVSILGGVIGPDSILNGTAYSGSYALYDGFVYGAGKGTVFPDAATVGFDYDRNYYVSYVNKTYVFIGDSNNRSSQYNITSPHVTASVFGGGENGHVRFDTYVQTNRGQIGLRQLTNVSSEVGHWADRGNIFGAGRGEDLLPDDSHCQSAGSVTRNTTIDILGARVYRNVMGGGAMASVGPLKGSTGDSSTCVINIRLPQATDTLGGSKSNTTSAFGGYILGGSRGIPSPEGTDNSALATCHNSQINIYEGWIRNTLYGGGENGQMLGNTEINTYGGYVRSAIYGGGKGAWKDTPANVGYPGDFTNDTLAGFVSGNTLVNLLGGEMPFTYGGCRRANVGGNATVNIGKDNGDGTYSGDVSFIPGKDKVYGGNQYAGSPYGYITVNVYKTAHTTTNTATYTGDDATYAINAVYGGSYNSDYLPRAAGRYAKVHIYTCDNTINEVYGGCAAADAGAKPGIGADTKLIIDGGRFNRVFGGGDGTYDRYVGQSVPANIYGTAYTEIHGGKINSLFGGSNTFGAPEAINITVEKDGNCAGDIEGDEFFGGSNIADLGTAESPATLSTTLGCGAKFKNAYGGSNKADIIGNVTLTIKAGEYDTVYAGSKGAVEPESATDSAKAVAQADITGNTHLILNGGTIGSAFGGSNINGNITGTITVDVEDSNKTCDPLRIDNVYGSGNLAIYEPTNPAVISPVVNLINCTVGYATAIDANHPAFDPADPGNHGRVFGAGKGDQNDINAGKVAANPQVNIIAADDDNNVRILNSVYGGGEIAMVEGNTAVNLTHGHVGSLTKNIDEDNGYVFGGGKGYSGDDVADNYKLATVTGNATVTMTGGYVHNTLFGGGQMASVGTFTYAAAADAANDIVEGEQNACTAGGTTTVNISGGQVGPTNVTMRADLGYVFGAGMGYYTQPAAPGYANPFDIESIESGKKNGRFGYVNNTVVNISDSAFIVGAVWGGSENGQVLSNCNVTISGGQIGCGKNKNAAYTKANWTTAKNAVDAYYANPTPANETALNNIAAQMPECDSWPYRHDTTINGTTYKYLPYDAYAEDDPLPEQEVNYASTNAPGDGHTFFGNVFGGGSGYYPYRITTRNHDDSADSTFSQWYNFQGRVRGNTTVTISDSAHILTSVYGGCEYADVVGNCTVNMTGGTVGVPRTVEAIQNHPVTCFIYGAGKGDQRTTFNGRTNINSATVSVTGGVVYGSVYGGGEDGHALGNTAVTIGGDALIGTWGTSYYDGNVFGGGRGFGGTAHTAGSIEGNATVNIQGTCKVLGSVYGGGRLASVGMNFTDPSYNLISENPEQHGNIVINISGGTIGNGAEFTHPQFSTSTAYAVGDVVYYENSLWRFTAAHPAGDWNTAQVTDVVHTTGGNVFGSSMGRLLKIGESDETVAANFNPLWPGLAKCRSTQINITGNARIFSNVYGGGELGYVMGNTGVSINGADVIIGHAVGEGTPDVCYFGSVYGGGYGSDNFVQHTNDTAGFTTEFVTAAMHAGRVYGNAAVTLQAGHVLANVYGGGELGSIGRRWLHMANAYDPLDPFKFQHPYNGTDATHTYSINGVEHTSYGYSENIGNTVVTISGGTVGEVDPAKTVLNTHRVAGRSCGRVGGVFGGSKGRPGYRDEEGHHGFHHTRMAYVDSAIVNIYGGQIAASVFGGGENGHVRYGTRVTMTGGTVGLTLTDAEKATDATGFSDVVVYFGNVYGGGRGIDLTDDGFLGEAAGQVFGNTVVEISGGTVTHNVYGGGSIASVGTYVTQPIDPGEHADANTGKATVTISGSALIGSDGINNGQVYGSGRGIAWSNNDYAHKAFVNNTEVNIQGGQVKGSVFGGGANGHVMTDTRVNVTGGTIGSPINKTEWTQQQAYTSATYGAGNANAYNGGTGSGWVVYPQNDPSDPNYDDYLSLDGTAAKIHFHGNVYGGGRGVDRHEDTLSTTAGRVYGDTYVEISGGTIYHNVYGGGSMASVGTYSDTIITPGTSHATFGGKTNVTISGGQIGTTGNNNGHVFGSCRGMAGATYGHLAFVDSTNVTIEDNADIRGSVFGSGENGHVLGSTNVEMTGGIVGRELTVCYTVDAEGNEWQFGECCTDQYGYDNIHIYRGNVYGGGRGVDLTDDNVLSYTAGTVYGNTNVTITGGTVTHSVYGGGSLASVGTTKYKANASDEAYTSTEPVVIDPTVAPENWQFYDLEGKMTENTGTATVTIGGNAIIGRAGTFFINRRGFNNGRVFGSGRGVAGEDYASRANVFNTVVNIVGGTINGSVFGSGENGHVRGNTEVNISGGEIGHNMEQTITDIKEGSFVPADQKAIYLQRINNIGNVYGSGRGVDKTRDGSGYSFSAGYVRGNATVNVTGGLIHRSVYGGGSMAMVGDYGMYGELDYIVTDGTGVDGKPIVNSGLVTVNIHSSVGTAGEVAKGFGGDVYGSSRGRANDPNNTLDFADMAYVFKTQVNIGNSAGNEEFTIYGNVYGGGEAGHVDWGGTTVNIMSGTVKGSVFGGGKGTSTSPTAGIVDGPTLVNIGLESQTGGNNVRVEGYVFGANDAGSSPLGEMNVHVWHTDHDANNAYPAPDSAGSYSVAYKAALMNEAAASVATNYALKGVYGGGNKASILTGDLAIDAPGWTGAALTHLNRKYIDERLVQVPSVQADHSPWPGGTSRVSNVTIHYCDENTVQYVYGGGKAANTKENNVVIEGGRVYQAFAGGDGYSSTGNHTDPNAPEYNPGADVSGNATLDIQGGLVLQAFGGSNQKGIIYGTSTVNIPEEVLTCNRVIKEIYGGGNEADGGDIVLTIPCGAEGIDVVYGGAKNADIGTESEPKNITLNIEGGDLQKVFGGNNQGGIIWGNVTLNIYGGSIKQAFGGNNQGGNIKGTITVNVDSSRTDCPLNLDYVYGGGEQAAYTPTNATLDYPRVNILRGTVNYDVFGGGLGASAIVTSNPKVVMGERTVNPDDTPRVGRNIFGGGSEAPVTGNTSVAIKNSSTVGGNVYGGGNAATVTGSTDVQIGN